MDTLTAILTIGLIVRTTRLLVMDRITHPLRAWIVIHLPRPIGYLVCCAWCMSVWIAAAVAAVWWVWGDTRWWFAIALAGTASLAAGLHATWLDPTDDDEDA